jgi:hypothetical protein
MRMHRDSIVGLVAALAALLLVAVCGSASAQLTNPSFESPDASLGDVAGAAGWVTFNQVYTTATVSHVGSQCLKTYGPFFQYGGTGATQLLPALPGQTWTSQIWALNWSADPIDNVDFGVLKIDFLNSSQQLAAGGLAGVDIFESNPINAATPRDEWTLLGVGTAPAPAGTAWARIVIVKVDMDGIGGGSIFWDLAAALQPPSGVADTPASLSFQLLPNTPNPFGPATRIGFVLGRPDAVSLAVYDVAGRLVTTLLQGRLEAGSNSVTWNGTTANGASAPAGVYRYVMRTSEGQASRSMILMK